MAQIVCTYHVYEERDHRVFHTGQLVNIVTTDYREYPDAYLEDINYDKNEITILDDARNKAVIGIDDILYIS